MPLMRERISSPSRARTAVDPPGPVSLLARHRGVSNRTVHGLLEFADQRMAHALWQAPPEVIAVLGARRAGRWSPACATTSSRWSAGT